MRMWSRHKFLTCLLSVMVLASGCTAVNLLDTSAIGIFKKEDVNLAEKNYAAADFLIQQAETFIGDRDVIKAITLKDSDEHRTYSPLGRMIPEQVGVRLSQLGYNMDLSEVSQDEALNYLKQGDAASRKPAFLLSGTYKRRRLDLDVSLRITETRTKRIVAVFDYILPMNSEIADLSEPETRIFKVTE